MKKANVIPLYSELSKLLPQLLGAEGLCLTQLNARSASNGKITIEIYTSEVKPSEKLDRSKQK